jgi:hypothetical protein
MRYVQSRHRRDIEHTIDVAVGPRAGNDASTGGPAQAPSKLHIGEDPLDCVMQCSHVLGATSRPVPVGDDVADCPRAARSDDRQPAAMLFNATSGDASPRSEPPQHRLASTARRARGFWP